MQRDGTRTSIWQHAMPVFQSQENLPDRLFDVIIVGGGITGVTTGLLLQKAGFSCLLLEAYTLGFGTTGGTTAHLNTLVDTPYNIIQKDFGEEKAHLVAEVTREAIETIKQNIKDYNISCGFEELPGYLFSQDKDQTKELDEIVEACRDAGLFVQYTNTIPVPIPFDKAMQIADQAQFHPTEYLYQLAKAFQEAGGMIVQNCIVTDAANDEHVEVVTNLGKAKAKNLIYATHIPPGVNLIHLRCAPYRSYALAIRLKNNEYPRGLVYDMYTPYHYYRTQNVNGQDYLIAGGEDHKTAHEENTGACFLKLESHCRKYFDVDTVAFKWSSQFYEPADGLPYIGHYPGHSKNVFVATGYSGNGMTYGTVAALVLKDLVMNGSGKYKDLFNPARIKPVAGFSNFVKENLDVAKQLIGRLFPKEKLEELANLAHGEAKVIKYEDHTIALFKDDAGNLHALNPTCTHLKCSVKWNIAEQSWDCPCHGARYDYEGKVLNGPAIKNLEVVEINELTS